MSKMTTIQDHVLELQLCILNTAALRIKQEKNNNNDDDEVATQILKNQEMSMIGDLNKWQSIESVEHFLIKYDNYQKEQREMLCN